uniref:Uncharacterized protein n=1 Tax=Megaselia scalaris TaxID=36166 RepID=T1GEI5_MEGSC
MAVVRKKQDDKYLKQLRELVNTGAGNRQCFDCGQKGPTYILMECLMHLKFLNVECLFLNEPFTWQKG